jgi:hypothetical protein
MTYAPGAAPVPPLGKAATAVRTRLVDTLRRDLIGPGPEDTDLARELLKENPSRWYLTGFLAPSLDSEAEEEVDDEGSRSTTTKGPTRRRARRAPPTTPPRTSPRGVRGGCALWQVMA